MSSQNISNPAPRSKALLGRFDQGSLPLHQYKLRENLTFDSRQAGNSNGVLRVGFVLRVLFECYGVRVNQFNTWLSGKGESYKVPNSHCSKGVGKAIPENILNLAIDFVSANKKKLDKYFPKRDIFAIKYHEFNTLCSDILGGYTEEDYHPPFTDLHQLDSNTTRDSIIRFIRREGAFKRIKHELNHHIIENKEPICSLFGSPTTDVTLILKEWIQSYASSASNDTSTYAIDLSNINYMVEVLNNIYLRISQDLDQKAENSEKNIKDLLNIHVSSYYERLNNAIKQGHRRYIFIFLNLKPLINLTSSDLPINNAVNGRDWIELVRILHEISIRNQDRIQILFTSSDGPESYHSLFPVKPKTINFHASSISLFEEAAKNTAYPLTAKLMRDVPSSLLSVKQIRLLSIAESACTSLADLPYIEKNMQIYVDLVHEGEADTVIYRWLKLCTVNWDDYYENISSDDKHKLESTNPTENKEMLYFLLLCGFSSDGIKLKSADYIIKSLRPSPSKDSNTNEISERKNDTPIFYKRRIINRLLDTILVEQQDQSDTGSMSYRFDDITLKQIFCKKLTNEIIESEGEHSVTVSNIRFLLARLSFRTLVCTYLPPLEDDHYHSEFKNIYDCIYDDRHFCSIIEFITNIIRQTESKDIDLEKYLSSYNPSNHSDKYFLKAYLAMLSVDKAPTSEQILRISQIVDNILHVAEPTIEKIKEINHFSDHSLSDIEVFNSLFNDLNNGNLYSQSNEDRSSNTTDKLDAIKVDIERWTLKLIIYAYLLIYRLLDLQETFASSKIINNGNKIRYSLLIRFFQLRSKGRIQHRNNPQGTALRNEGSHFISVLPQATMLACRQGNSNSNFHPLFHFLESTAISAIKVGKFDIFMSILSEVNTVENLRQAEAKFTKDNATDDKDTSMFFSFVGGKRWPNYLTIFTIKAHIWIGQLSRASGLSKLYLERYNEYESSPGGASKINIIRALTFRINTALGLYHKVAKDVQKAKLPDSMNNIEFSIDLSDGKNRPLIEIFSALLRLETIGHRDFKTFEKKLTPESRIFIKIQELIKKACEQGKTNISKYVGRSNNTIIDPLYEYKKLSNETICNDSIRSLEIDEYIHLEVLLCSKRILSAEKTEDKNARIQKRIEAAKGIGDILNNLTPITLFSISPFHHMTYEIGYVRYMLYSALSLNAPPSLIVGKKIENMLEQKKHAYPLFYCQVQILHAEYVRQKMSFDHNNDNYYVQLDEILTEIEGLIAKYEYRDKLFELQLLRDACNIEKIESRGYQDGDAVLWLVM